MSESKSYLDLPEFQNLKGPIFELAAIKEKRELLQKVISQLKRDHFDSDFSILIQFITYQIDYPDEPDDKSTESGGCLHILRNGPNRGNFCLRKIEKGGLCKLHNDILDRTTEGDIKKIVSDLLGLK